MPYRIPTNTVLPINIADATETAAGVMSAEDKRKLDAIAPGDGTRTITTIYVRPTGSDATGDGTLANPYRTVAYASQQLTRYADQLYQIIDCTGIGTETLTSTLHIPPVVSSSHVIADPSPVYGGFGVVAAVTIRAVPATVVTIVPGFTVNPSTTTGLAEIVVLGAGWTVNEHKGRKLYWGGAVLSTIYANTADTLYVCTDANFISNADPVYIVEETAELRLTGASSTAATLQIMGTQASVALLGLKVTRATPASYSNQSLEVAQIEDFLAYGCTFEGVSFYGAIATNPLLSGCWLKAPSTFEAFNLFGSGFSAVDTFWDAITCDWNTQGSFPVYVLTSVYDGCNAVGHATTSLPAINYQFIQTLIRNGTEEGVRYRCGLPCLLSSVRIENCVGDGINAASPGRLDLAGVTGSGNGGYGLQATRGANVDVDAGVTVTGTSGDLKVGGLAVRTWADFRTNPPLQRQADFFNAATSDGSVVAE